MAFSVLPFVPWKIFLVILVVPVIACSSLPKKTLMARYLKAIVSLILISSSSSIVSSCVAQVVRADKMSSGICSSLTNSSFESKQILTVLKDFLYLSSCNACSKSSANVIKGGGRGVAPFLKECLLLAERQSSVSSRQSMLSSESSALFQRF